MVTVPPARVVRGVGGRHAALRVALVDGARTAGRYARFALRAVAVTACLGLMLGIIAIGANTHRREPPSVPADKLLEDLRRWSAHEDAAFAQHLRVEAQQIQQRLKLVRHD